MAIREDWVTEKRLVCSPKPRKIFIWDTPACFITTTQFGEGIILFQIKPSSDLNLLNILFHQYSSTCGKISVIFFNAVFYKILDKRFDSKNVWESW